MDPLLATLQSRSCGLSIHSLYLGAFCHADDIRTLAACRDDCSIQIAEVRSYATSGCLSMNVEKCEAVISPSLCNAPPMLTDWDISIPVTAAAYCLGTRWTPDLSCSKCLDVNISKTKKCLLCQREGHVSSKVQPYVIQKYH